MKSTDKTYQNIVGQAAIECRRSNHPVLMLETNGKYSFMLQGKQRLLYAYILTPGKNGKVTVTDNKGKVKEVLELAKREETPEKKVKASKKEPKDIKD